MTTEPRITPEEVVAADDYRREFLNKLLPFIRSQGTPNERKNDGMVQALLCCAATVECASRRIDPNKLSTVIAEVYDKFQDVCERHEP